MYDKALGAWMRAGFDMWSLGIESSSVIALRLAKISLGGDAGSKEAALMVSEKVQASAEIMAGLMTGQLGTTPLAGTNSVVGNYRRKVAANRRRLSR
jgi:hypothetical protein